MTKGVGDSPQMLEKFGDLDAFSSYARFVFCLGTWHNRAAHGLPSARYYGRALPCGSSSETRWYREPFRGTLWEHEESHEEAQPSSVQEDIRTQSIICTAQRHPELTADEALELLDPALHAQVDRLCVTEVDDEAAEEVWLDLIDDVQGCVLLANLCRVDGLLQTVDSGLVECLGSWVMQTNVGSQSSCSGATQRTCTFMRATAMPVMRLG